MRESISCVGASAGSKTRDGARRVTTVVVPGFFRMVVTSLSVSMLLLCSFSGFASSDIPHEERGYQGSGYSLSDYENINLANGNLTFRVPIHTLRTDGGLEYDVAAYFNSKFWYLHHYCSSNMYGYFNCEDNGFETLDAQIADGVSAYGFGWDLRPPRVRFNVPPDGMPVLVDASGAAHPMCPYEPWATSGRSLGRNRDGSR